MPSASEPNDVSREQIIWQVVCSIPPGYVASYSQVAELAGFKGLARFVGRAMGQLPEGSDVPWHRVLKQDGRIAFPPESNRFYYQSRLLTEEGVLVKKGRVPMARFRWQP
ncbi:cysteine methyltransferase [Marinobacter sp. R17]|uniref:MGMT family protein n=1 Tax=Marinobacter sp. R17 TaxID=2484250 RepID=UPI000F4CC6DB|nr:MGMT family protein [Marinobacter sp. R17]ROU01711.1 cysteine methyltransferase [Marinobacter sp. R17]